MIAALTALFFGLGSCTKCTICTQQGWQTLKVCQNDYNSVAFYDSIVNGYVKQGYVCGQ